MWIPRAQWGPFQKKPSKKAVLPPERASRPAKLSFFVLQHQVVPFLGRNGRRNYVSLILNETYPCFIY